MANPETKWQEFYRTAGTVAFIAIVLVVVILVLPIIAIALPFLLAFVIVGAVKGQRIAI